MTFEPRVTDESTLKIMRAENNPHGLPVGHFTGRCSNCHSRNLWDDNSAYGCNDCGAIFFTGDIMPRLIPNGHQNKE